MWLAKRQAVAYSLLVAAVVVFCLFLASDQGGGLWPDSLRSRSEKTFPWTWQRALHLITQSNVDDLPAFRVGSEGGRRRKWVGFNWGLGSTT